MITDARTLPDGTVLDGDVCIIGGGPAGIAIAHELRDTPQRIILLESGAWRETPESVDLNKGAVMWPGAHEPLEENRRRVFGGSTSAWGGRAVPFDGIDFETRAWVPCSGWPLSRADLEQYYARAVKLSDAGECRFTVEEAFPGRQREMIAGFDSPDVVSNRLERWGPPVHFGRRYAPDLRRAPRIQAFLNATCVRLRATANADRVLQAEVACGTRDHRVTVRAQRFVIAGGALENARLLLASNAERGEGLGNAYDNVGRYYMTHGHGVFAHARLRDIGDNFFYEFERDDGVYCRRRFWLTPATQTRLQTLNAIAFFFRSSELDSADASGLLSAVHLAKVTLSSIRGNGRQSLFDDRAELVNHLRRIGHDAPRLLPQFVAIVRQRVFAKRRLPYVLPPRSQNRFCLQYQTEHAPNRESRVRLHSERDALGMPRLEVGLRFGDLDRRTIIELHRVIRTRFESSGTGELCYDEGELGEYVDKLFEQPNSVAFQLGTTRMAAHPRDGVVDPNCRVHGIANLFVAGASVYPTGGHANPGLTLIALAVRLADHLRALRP